jgi:hypothetical protein
MLKPQAANITKNSATWNQSRPKYQRYAGTAVSVSTSVPMRNELVVQLMRARGRRKSEELDSVSLVLAAIRAGAAAVGRLVIIYQHLWLNATCVSVFPVERSLVPLSVTPYCFA